MPNDSSLLIDATLKQAFPPLALPTREFMDRARKIWDELGLPALSPQPPWHGYTLGDWNETWETYAKRAVAGAWEQSGKETFAQKRGGMTPETPVRDADDKSGNARPLLLHPSAAPHCCTATLNRQLRTRLSISAAEPTMAHIA